jgi:GT2 family glycosyltransferase
MRNTDLKSLVTVIIVNWNGKNIVFRCLDSLRRQSFKRFSAILVDNGSTDGSVEVVQRHYPEVDIIKLNYNTGFCIANNKVLLDIKTKYVALVNNDAILADNWLYQMVQGLETDPESDFATGKLLFLDNSSTIDRAGDGYSWAGAGVLRGRGCHCKMFNRSEKIFGACAAAALYRKKMIDRIGGFDEDFFLIQEDVDLSFRAQLSGHQCIYIPAAVAFHGVSSSIVKNSPISVYYGHRNLEWVWLKNMPIGLLIFLSPLHLLYVFGSLIYFTASGQCRFFLRAKIDAVKKIKIFWHKRKIVQQSKTVSSGYIFSLFEKEWFFTRLLHRKNTSHDRRRHCQL